MECLRDETAAVINKTPREAAEARLIVSIAKHTLRTVRERLQRENPELAKELRFKTRARTLRNPDDTRHALNTTIHWPSRGDPSSFVRLEANLPGNLLPNDNGYLNITFSRTDSDYIGNRVDTDLQFAYGRIGCIGLLRPIGVYRDLNIRTVDVETRMHHEADARVIVPILGQFGILRPERSFSVH